MENSPDGVASETSLHDHQSDGDRWWPLLGGNLQLPRALEGPALTAVLLLFVVAAGSDRKNALPASGRVLNLVCELQQTNGGDAPDAELRASVIARLSAAITGLRTELD